MSMGLQSEVSSLSCAHSMNKRALGGKSCENFTT